MGDSSNSTGTGEKRAHETSADSPDIKIEEDLINPTLQHADFVVVADSTGEAMELPTASDNTLYMTTLQATYPGATGMKYKNPKTGALRAVAVDATGTKLLPPADGWDDKVFTVITSNSRNDRVDVLKAFVVLAHLRSSTDVSVEIRSLRVVLHRSVPELLFIILAMQISQEIVKAGFVISAMT
ncbi:unnamed protein product [Strongylus vulgaris]|uniref:TAR DNA-binding protein 43 N-terminal domain-containing protein n=1 Tax=Strongylus vulgaris TaxID=40348 RepID=A0A3P7JYG4_STRVU|nr:unnamed protein product [Strongylus vulgaris]